VDPVNGTPLVAHTRMHATHPVAPVWPSPRSPSTHKHHGLPGGRVPRTPNRAPSRAPNRPTPARAPGLAPASGALDSKPKPKPKPPQGRKIRHACGSRARGDRPMAAQMQSSAASLRPRRPLGIECAGCIDGGDFFGIAMGARVRADGRREGLCGSRLGCVSGGHRDPRV
jgi:hypothetical protein